MAKVHLRANKLTGTNAAVALCAARTIKGGSKIGANRRATYVCMASEIIGYDEYKLRASKDRCAHCDNAMAAHNTKRVALGLRSWDLNELAK